MATKWGIIGAGFIANDFLVALRTLAESEHEVVAVAARTLERAQDFGKKHNIQQTYGSYEELVRDPKVQVVYVSTIHPTHVPLSKLALNHGKHVLCEKPMAINSREANDVLALAKSKGLFFMEALWMRFSPLYAEVIHQIKLGAIGEVQVIMISFGAVLEGVKRMDDRGMCGGALLDLGIYTLNVADMVFGGEEPLCITAAGSLTDSGVDRTVGITLLYSSKRSAHLTVSMAVNLPNEAVIAGSKGTMTISSPFHCPTKLITAEGSKLFPLPETQMAMNFPNSTGMRFEIQEVRNSLLAGEVESKIMPHNTSQRIMRWMDEIRQQIGVIYKQDSPLS